MNLFGNKKKDAPEAAQTPAVVPTAQPAVPAQMPATTTVTAKSENIRSLIGPGETIKGDLELRAGIKIDGRVIGNVTINADIGAVVITQGASVEGNIMAPKVYVLGMVIGNINAAGVIVGNGASVTGDISYEAIRVADGADIEGAVRRRFRAKDVSPGDNVRQSQAAAPAAEAAGGATILRVATA